MPEEKYWYKNNKNGSATNTLSYKMWLAISSFIRLFWLCLLFEILKNIYAQLRKMSDDTMRRVIKILNLIFYLELIGFVVLLINFPPLLVTISICQKFTMLRETYYTCNSIEVIGVFVFSIFIITRLQMFMDLKYVEICT